MYEEWAIGEMTMFVLQDMARDVGMHKLDIFPSVLRPQLTALVGKKRLYHSVNVFLLHAGKDWVLFDSGYGKEAGGKMRQAMQDVGVTPEEISIVALTHMHPDHIGGLVEGSRPAFPNARLFVHPNERAYWGTPVKDPMFREAQHVLSAYEHMIKDALPDTPLIPGVVPIEGFGHTPGHMMYHVFSKTENCYVIGDLLHEPAVQLKYPEISVSYDIEPEKAAGLRQTMLRFLAKEIMPVAGAHLPYPGVCRLIEAAGGGYQSLEL